MRNESVEELTAQLQDLILEHRRKEKALVKRIRKAEIDESKDKNTTIDDTCLRIGDEVTYATNGTHRRSNKGTIVKFTKHRVVIRTESGEEVYRATNNVYRKS